MFSEENNLESPSNKTERHYTHHTTTQVGLQNQLLSHKYTPHV